MRRAAASARGGVARAEQAADDDLAGDRDRVEDEGQEDEDLEGDLVGAERGGALARQDRAGDDEGEQQRAGAHDDVAAHAGEALELAARAAGGWCAGARSSMTANAAPIPAWAIDRARAALPSRPQSKPYTNSSSRTMLTTLATTTTTSGVRRSPTPRR